MRSAMSHSQVSSCHYSPAPSTDAVGGMRAGRAHACKLGLEGIVSKRRHSRYRSGRSPNCFALSAFNRCQPPNLMASAPTMRPMSGVRAGGRLDNCRVGSERDNLVAV
jgi:hypothetical protein